MTLTPVEARVLGTLMEKARTVPDSYPLSLNSLLLGCNQKTSREPLMELDEAQVATALDSLKSAGLVRESSGGRTTRCPGRTWWPARSAGWPNCLMPPVRTAVM